MTSPLLITKLYIPPIRPELVSRPRLIERLNDGLHRKLTLISAPAGFGKTTLVSEWIQSVGEATPPIAIAWLSLDEGDNDPARFLAYLVAALQTIDGDIGQGVLAALQSPGPVNVELVLTVLLNEIAVLSDSLVLVLDDYHVIESQPIDKALAFLLDHLPPQMHLVIASRSDPSLALSRLRARGQMTEIRADDLRFTLDEVTAFLDKAMDLDLSAENVAALGTRTEGWIAGLQLAALALQGTLSMQGIKGGGEIADFVNRFTGSDRYIQDYLADEVLQQRPKGSKDFLLQTSILDRLSGPLCDAVTGQKNSQAILQALKAANLFIVPLDNERRWYRYHHLFADLLRQRLHQNPPPLSSPPRGGTGDLSSPPLGEPALSLSKGTEGGIVAELHSRASQWYEENGLEIKAFHHAVAANDVERAERLIEGDVVPLQYRGAAVPVLNWLESLPTTVLDARPSLWVAYASASNLAGRPIGSTEEKLKAAQAALQGAEPDDKTRDLVGHIAAIRAMMAVAQNQVETIIAQSRRALEFLHPDNLPVRTSTIWTMAYAYQLQGDRAAASRAYTQVLSISEASGDVISTLAATTGLGAIQETENQLYLAAESYRRGLQLFGDQPQPVTCETYLGLARILYEWNDLDAAQQHGQQSLQLARQVQTVDTFGICGVVLARLKLAQGDVSGAAAMLAQAEQFMRQHNFVDRMDEVFAAQVLVLLYQGNPAAAADLAEKHDLPISQARVHLAQGDPGKATALLEPLRHQAADEDRPDERLKVTVLQAVAHQARGEKEQAVQLLGNALALAEPGGFIRTFVDEGTPMAQLLSESVAQGVVSDYANKLLAAFRVEEQPAPLAQPLVEPLSQRELQVLQLVAQGLSNREIGERLFLALPTVKGHNRRIYGKLQVQRRTEAVSRARELGLL